MALVGNIESYRRGHNPQRLTKCLYMIHDSYESISKHTVVDLTLNQSQTLVSPIFRSGLLGTICGGRAFPKNVSGDKSATLKTGPKNNCK